MLQQLKAIIKDIEADYADVRYEIKREAEVVFSGRELKKIGSNTTDGYVVRILKEGGFCSATFTRLENAPKAVRRAVENARIMGKNRDKPIRLADAEVVRGSFLPALREDPRKISMDEKLDLIRRYNEIPLGYDGIASTEIHYFDLAREKYYLNSEGSEIREDLITVAIRGTITSQEGNLTQNVRVSAGGSDGFHSIRNQEAYMEKRTSIALELLKARPAQGGTYPCVLNPSLAGVFAHEAFGHFSEADILESLPSMREKMKLGARLASEMVNISDDATIPNQLGFYQYDDEGQKVCRTPLIQEGRLVGRLHSRRTAAEFGEPLSGHMVAEDYRYPPIIRMGTIFIEPGAARLPDLLAKMGDGLYILDAKGGQTAGESFTFGAQYGYLVKGGRLGPMIRDINLSGNLYETLKNIRDLGNDLTLSKIGGCGKGQLNLRSCTGGPHVLIDKLVIGGLS